MTLEDLEQALAGAAHVTFIGPAYGKWACTLTAESRGVRATNHLPRGLVLRGSGATITLAVEDALTKLGVALLRFNPDQDKETL